MIYQPCLRSYTAPNSNTPQVSAVQPQFLVSKGASQPSQYDYLAASTLNNQELAPNQFATPAPALTPTPFYINPPIPIFAKEKQFVCINNLPTCTNVKCGKYGECSKCYMRHYMRQYKRDESAAKESGI